MSGPLSALLRRRIQAAGPITVGDYMAEALGHPEHGYYMTRDPLGAAGDFITAPEVSQMFGELVGLWCAEMWRACRAPDPVQLVELGPGRGTLMADALRASRLAPEFTRALSVNLVETSPVLRERQRETLAGQADPTAIHLVFSAHGLPVSFVRKGDVYQQQVIATVARVMAGLPNPHSLAYQSKVGPVKWLTPATDQHIRSLAAQGIKRVAVVPIAFVCEHLETLYELDILIRDIAVEAGIATYLRVPALGVHPRFIRALADIVHHADRYALA